MPNYIWKNGRRYYHYGNYDNWPEALRLIRYHKKKYKARYYVITYEAGHFFPTKKYKLYFDKIIKFG